MSAISISARRGANSATGQLVGNDRPMRRSISPAMHAARSLWPRKTAAELAEITGASVRTAERWLAGDRALSTAALAALIRSEHGLDFLVALMAGAEPPWWRRVNAYFAAIDAQRLQRAARRRLREAIDADAALSAAISGARIPFLFRMRTSIASRLMHCAQRLAYLIAPWLRPIETDEDLHRR